MKLDDVGTSGDKDLIYKTMRSSRKRDRIRLLGALLKHYYKNDPLIVQVGQFLLDGQSDTTLIPLLDTNRLTKIMVDIERSENPELTFEAACLVVGGKLGYEPSDVLSRIQKAYSRAGGQKTQNLSADSRTE